VASGRCDIGIIGAAQVDKYGNVNTTGFWIKTVVNTGLIQECVSMAAAAPMKSAVDAKEW